VLGLCVCLGLYGPAGKGPQLPSLSGVDTIQRDGAPSSGTDDGPQLPPDHAVSAMVAFATGTSSPFLAIADENIGEVRLAPWPDGKAERALEGSRLGPIWDPSVAEPTAWRVVGANGPAGPLGMTQPPVSVTINLAKNL
jgi:hypothetical protein